MSFRLALRHTPAGILCLVLPFAALILSAVISFAQRDSITPGLSLSDSDSAAAKVAARDPVMDLKTEPTLCHPEASIDPVEMYQHKIDHARALALQLERRAASSPCQMTPISAGDLHLLRSAIPTLPRKRD